MLNVRLLVAIEKEMLTFHVKALYIVVSVVVVGLLRGGRV
jgi:hypothetical protein